jgi:uncharacterized protein
MRVAFLKAIDGAVHLPMNTVVMIALVVLVAALIRGLTGFGFAILAVPLLGLVIPPSQAVIFAIIMQLLIGPFGVPQAWAQIDRRAVGWIVGFAWISTPIGLWLLSTLAVEAARVIIAGIGLGCFFLFLIKRAPTPNTAPLHLAATGLASGLLNGFAAMPGPPVILYFVRDGVPPRVARGSMITVFAGTAIAGTAVAALRGMITRELIVMALLALPIMITGNHIGARFFGSVSEELWRGLVIALLLVAAMGAVARI